MLFDFPRPRSREQIRVIGLNAPRGRRAAVVGVNGNEQAGLRLVGEISALIERQVRFAPSPEPLFRPQSRLYRTVQNRGYMQQQTFLQRSLACHPALLPTTASR